MTEWREVTLAEVCSSVDYGYTASSSLEPVGPRFLRITDIAGSNLNWAEVPYCEIDNESFEKFRLVQGDIVVARTGATVGHGRWVSPPEPSVFASYLVRFRPSDDVNARFIGHVVESSIYKEFVKRSAGGAAQPNANAKVLGSFPLRLPDRASQDRIVSLVQPIDDLIESNQRRIALLERMAQAIYREWFVHFRYPGHDDDELVDSPRGPIPGGWRVVPFLELADYLNGFAFKPAHWGDVGLPIVKIKELKEGVTASTPRYDGDDISPKYRIDSGDLLFSWSAHLDAYLWSGGRALLNQHLFKVKPFSGVAKSWLFLTLREDMDEFRSRSQGTTMKHIKRAALREVSAVVPTKQLMQRFDDVTNPILDERITLSRLSRSLEAMCDLLLPRLVTGAIDVSHFDLDALLDETAA